MNTNTKISTKCRVNSFIICDAIHIDPATGKHSILGTFSTLRVVKFPAYHRKMDWFLSLSELHRGEHNLKIFLADPTGELESKLLIDRDFESPDPQHKINLVNEIRNLKVLKAIDYSIVIEVDNEIVFVDTLQVQGIEHYDEDYEDEYEDYEGFENNDSVF